MRGYQKTTFLATASVLVEDVIEAKKKDEETDVDYVDEQPDLMRIDSVLVSTGMNANDDVFLRDELINARATGKHKPLNVEHNDDKIIGHMIDTFIATKDGKKIEEKDIVENPNKIPNSFDIISESVVYAEVFPEQARKIRDLARKNKLFVSVEAWFSDYDYIVGNRIVERNEATVGHFDKILRINGGEGVVNGQKVGRVLRNLILAGIGLVKNPANKDSVIRSVCEDKFNSDDNLEEIISANLLSEFNGGSMPEKEMELEKAQASVSQEQPQVVAEVIPVIDNVQPPVSVEAEQKNNNDNQITTAESINTEDTSDALVNRVKELEAIIASLNEQLQKRDEAYTQKFENAMARINELKMDKASAEEVSKPVEEPKQEEVAKVEPVQDVAPAPAPAPEPPPAPVVPVVPVVQQEAPIKEVDDAIEDAVDDALKNAEKETDVVDFTTEEEEDSLCTQYAEVLDSLDIGIIKDKE